MFQAATDCFDLAPRGPYHARAMGDPLRDRRAAADLAAKQQVVDFSAEIGDFERFSAALDADLQALVGPDAAPAVGRQAVTGTLVFSESDVPGICAELSGHIETRVTSVCQRCLQVFDWPLEVQLNLDLVEPGQTATEREGLELWELEAPAIRPVDIVDEALVMALPLSPKHEDPAACVEIDANESGEEKIRPFADLKARMDDDKRD
jgi:uncharacterized metal-binding protein YceD (DUF177 family)